jgi:hypothetical protein
MPHLTKVICKLKDRCINPSAKLTFGKVYELYDMKMVANDAILVFIDDNGAYRTYSLYKHCFMSIEEWRDSKLDDVLN